MGGMLETSDVSACPVTVGGRACSSCRVPWLLSSGNGKPCDWGALS